MTAAGPFTLEPTAIPGLHGVRPRVAVDPRGTFVKVYHRNAFESLGFDFSIAEEYYSASVKGVVRGLHFQLPPHAHDKVVFCLGGTVTDVVVDLRVGSPTYGVAESLHLDGEHGAGVFIPLGCAHGFEVTSDHATLLYMVTTVYEPSADAGIRWDSIPYEWKTGSPIVSPRDGAFPALAEFTSPFAFARR